jgi:hypothetical protein
MLSIRTNVWKVLALALVACCGVMLAPGYTSLAAPAPGDKPGAPVDTAKWIASDSQMVMTINIRQILESAMVKKAGGPKAITAELKKNEQVQALLKASGLDPVKDLDTILISGSGSPGKEAKVLMVIRGRYDLDKVHTAATDFAKKNPDELKISKEGTTRLYEIKNNDKSAFAAFADRSTLVVTQSKDSTVDAVKNLGKKAVTISKEMQAALKKFSGKESMAMAMIVTEEMKEALGKVPQAAEIAPKLKSLTGDITLTDAMNLQMLISTSDMKAAAKVLALLKQVKSLAELMVLNNEEIGPVASEMLGALKMATEKTNVTLTLKVTQAMLDKAGKKDK